MGVGGIWAWIWDTGGFASVTGGLAGPIPEEKVFYRLLSVRPSFLPYPVGPTKTRVPGPFVLMSDPRGFCAASSWGDDISLSASLRFY